MRSEERADTKLFREVVRTLLERGVSVRFRAHGRSMFPSIRDGEVVHVEAVKKVTHGDVVLVDTSDGLRVHRAIATGVTRGDCSFDSDGPGNLVGRVSLLHQGRTVQVPAITVAMRVRRWVARWRGRF